jgi:D-glycero-alpha-D-manno-heptose 1-phosphate guanylyltransferase
LKKQGFDAIILGGGASSRMKLESKVPKQLLPIYNNKSLLQYQIEWLQRYGVAEVILAIDDYTSEYIVEHIPYLLKMADVSIEMERLGTGGALKKAINQVTTDKIYAMNVDDFVLSDFYSPDELVNTIAQGFGASILTSRGHFPYGVIKSRGRRIIKFDQKPLMDFKVSAGHYAFSVDMIRKRFPSAGNFETMILSQLVDEKVVTFLDLDGKWITANTWKELRDARKSIEAYEHRRKYGVSKSSRPGGYRGYGKP